MYIEQTRSGYDRSGEQVARRARFLILVSLGMTEELAPCPDCAGFKRRIVGDDVDDASIVDCNRCNRVPCTTCERKGYTYDPESGASAKTCTACTGRGDIGPSGMVTKFTHQREIRALVRKVALHQFGHFMMGSARAFGHRLPISGAYGSDGLPRTVPREVFDRAVPIPAELHDAWNKGGGHNGAGSEAIAMRHWALANLDALESAKRKR